jgi:predicted RNA-binding Zn-ribbon protein involved in translation (DUF1610 family)
MLKQTSLDNVSIKSASENSSFSYGHDCGRNFLTIQCVHCGKRHFVLAGSRDRTCPACAKEIYRRQLLRYGPIVKNRKNLKFLTLTSKPIRKQDPRQVRDLGIWFNKLLHRKKFSKAWKGIIATVECKKSKTGLFYYHLHAIVEGDFIPQKEISDAWCQISGFPIVHIKRIWRTQTKAFRYVMKYVLKGFGFNDDKDKKDFKTSMKGVRYVRSYGSMYDFEYKTATHVYFPCPQCGSVKCWVVLEFCHQVDLIEGVSYDGSEALDCIE